MCRGTEPIRSWRGAALAWSAVLSLAVVGVARGQEVEAPGPTDALEAYLLDRGLDDLVSVYLLDRLREAPASRRAALADRLGSHYASLLSEAESAARQREIESMARELLDLVPDADSFELRLTLHRASFVLAEESAMNHALRLTEPAELSEAQRTFRELEPAFLQIGRRVDERVSALERMEDRATRANIGTIREQLASARRLRSLAMYYAGWSQYYQALINADSRKAEAALRSFGWLLNAPGHRAPEVDNLPVSMLRYEHVARAAMACALSESIAGRDGEAVRWLDAIEGASETAPAVREQLWRSRIEVLGRASRWHDLQRLVDRRRLGLDPAGATPLPLGEARALAVVTLEAIEAGGGGRAERERGVLLEALAQVALGDLVTRGEVGHVMDLVRRYGTTPMGDTGFVVLYVRALRAYERAREAHRNVAEGAGVDPDEPVRDPTVANRYMDAVRALGVAQGASDAERFPEERTQALMMEGLSLYYAGELVRAGDVFESVFERAGAEGLREEALWYAIVALDMAVESGTRSAVERRDRLATLYMRAFPGTDRSARLLLRRVDDGLLSDEQAIGVLLDVPRESALYQAARRHASRLMYGRYRAARGPERDYAAARFLEVVEELIQADIATVRRGGADEAAEAARAVVVRIRQALDAALSVTVPDPARAERLLSLLEDAASAGGVSLEGLEGELAFRRLQVALARGDDGAASDAAARLSAIGGPHARAGDRQLYRRLVERWERTPGDTDLALRLVGVGERVLAQFEPLEEHEGDRTVAGLLDVIARAATDVWLAEGAEEPDDSMRDVAIRADRRLIELGMQSASSLRRLARASESAGDLDTALRSWTTLMSGLREGASGWFEARVESIRVLAKVDREAARAALDQHRVLYPDLGPEPWRERFVELESSVRGGGAGGQETAEPDGGGG